MEDLVAQMVSIAPEILLMFFCHGKSGFNRYRRKIGFSDKILGFVVLSWHRDLLSLLGPKCTSHALSDDIEAL